MWAIQLTVHRKEIYNTKTSEERSQINDLCFHLKKPEKKEQGKSKVRRNKIIQVTLKPMKYLKKKQSIEIINETKSCSLRLIKLINH